MYIYAYIHICIMADSYITLTVSYCYLLQDISGLYIPIMMMHSSYSSMPVDHRSYSLDRAMNYPYLFAYYLHIDHLHRQH